MPKDQTKTKVVFLLMIDIISIAVFLFLFNYTKNLINESVTKSDQIKKELKQDEAKILIKDDLVLGEKYQEQLSDYMLPSGGTVDFIKTVEQLVSNSGLKTEINSVSTEAYSKDSSAKTELVRVKMDVTGEWKNMQFFLNSLENYPLKIDINKVSFNKVSDNLIKGKKVSQWSGNFEFTVVKIKDNK